MVCRNGQGFSRAVLPDKRHRGKFNGTVRLIWAMGWPIVKPIPPLRRAQALELDNARVREQKWGPRTLDVDLVCCRDGDSEVTSRDEGLTLPHPLAHLRAFVMIPWLAVDPEAVLTVAGERRPVDRLLAELEPADRDGVRLTGLVLNLPPDAVFEA